MSGNEIFEKEAGRLKELAAEKSCLVCNFYNSSECPAKGHLKSKGGSCAKWEYYLGRMQQ